MQATIKELITEELNEFNNSLKSNIYSDIEEFSEVLKFIFNTSGKQLRPIIGILAAKVIGEFNEKQNLFLQAIELIHNATLFHDDVIDNAKIRRNQKSLNEKFSNKLAILSGDFFLSVALKNIYQIQNAQLNSIVANYIKQICEGEIEQNFLLNKIISLDKYIEKTKRKTALLFELTLWGIAVLSDNNNDVYALKNFGLNFGIVFQLADDLNNFSESKDKPFLNDLETGVITAPVIFLAEDYPQIQQLLINKKYDKIIQLLNSSSAFNKTKMLINTYFKKAEQELDKLPKNKYTEGLYSLQESCNLSKI